METTTAKTSGQKDVYAIINDRVIELLEKGIVPWRVPWYAAGIPANLMTRKPYRGINSALLASLGYEHNIFVTENQLGEIGGSIKANEKPHMIARWNYKDGEDDKKGGTLSYYRVYNVAQCAGISADLLFGPHLELFPLDACESIVGHMPHCPAIKSKEQIAYYDPVTDVVNMPKKTAFNDPESYFAMLFHQLLHSTGHYTRLDRMGLIQMAECGYQSPSLEELVAEIGTGHLLSLTGIADKVEQDGISASGWLGYLQKNRYIIFNAFSLALKAIDFILDTESDVEDKQKEE